MGYWRNIPCLDKLCQSSRFAHPFFPVLRNVFGLVVTQEIQCELAVWKVQLLNKPDRAKYRNGTNTIVTYVKPIADLWSLHFTVLHLL